MRNSAGCRAVELADDEMGLKFPALVMYPAQMPGHFSFQSPFPPRMISPLFPPSQDPDGFDRPAFHEAMNADVLTFLRRVC